MLATHIHAFIGSLAYKYTHPQNSHTHSSIRYASILIYARYSFLCFSTSECVKKVEVEASAAAVRPLSRFSNATAFEFFFSVRPFVRAFFHFLLFCCCCCMLIMGLRLLSRRASHALWHHIQEKNIV